MEASLHPVAVPSDAVLIAVEPAELAGIESRTPKWERARALLAGVFTATRQGVAGQVLLGRELFALKREYGFEGSGRRKSARADFNSWAEYLRLELGISADFADRCIAAYKVIRHRGETALKDDSEEFRLLIAPPVSLTVEDQKRLQKAVGALLKGDDSQRSLLREFRLIRESKATPGGDTSANRKTTGVAGDPAVAASALFRALFNDLSKSKEEITQLLSDGKETDKLLFRLPEDTTDENIVGLLDYQNGLELLRRELDEQLKALCQRVAAMAEAKRKGDPPKRTRKKSTITQTKA